MIPFYDACVLVMDFDVENRDMTAEEFHVRNYTQELKELIPPVIELVPDAAH